MDLNAVLPSVWAFQWVCVGPCDGVLTVALVIVAIESCTVMLTSELRIDHS